MFCKISPVTAERLYSQGIIGMVEVIRGPWQPMKGMSQLQTEVNEVRATVNGLQAAQS